MLNAALLVLAMAPAGTDTIFQDGFDGVSDCPDGRQVIGDFAYGGEGSLRNRYNVDVTEWGNIWGHADALDQVVPWPGRANAVPIFLDFGVSMYIAAHFQVPAGTPSTWFGWIVQTDYNHEADLTGAISTACGDFNPSSPNCYTVGISGQNIVPWRTSTGTFCQLQPGLDYYLNLKVVDPSGCTAGTSCIIGTANTISTP